MLANFTAIRYTYTSVNVCIVNLKFNIVNGRVEASKVTHPPCLRVVYKSYITDNDHKLLCTVPFLQCFSLQWFLLSVASLAKMTVTSFKWLLYIGWKSLLPRLMQGVDTDGARVLCACGCF